MIAVQVIPDRFDMKQAAAGGVLQAISGGAHAVRRPTNGIQIKEDTFATLRVVLGAGGNVPLIDAGSRQTAMTTPDGKQANDVYSNFLIQQVTEERMEKQQIVETFGEAFIFFFGERPRVITVQGILANTFDFNWEAEWWENYDRYIRGTKCVENDARVFLNYDETLVSGYIIGSSTQKNAQDKNFVNFSFQMFVTGYTSLSRLGDPNAKQSYANPIGYEADDSTLRDAYNPDIIPYDGLPSSPDGIDLDSLTLVEGLVRTGIAEVQQVWNKASSILRNATTSINSMLGDVVRVPVGFAGALAFDSPDIEVPGKPGLATFSTFSDNDAEYVSNVGNDQYSGSSKYQGNVLFPEPFTELNDSRDLVLEARLQWMAMGFIVPPDGVQRMLDEANNLNKTFGLVDLGPSRNFLTAATQSTVGAGNQMVGGLTVAGSVVATGLSAVSSIGSSGTDGEAGPGTLDLYGQAVSSQITPMVESMSSTGSQLLDAVGRSGTNPEVG